MIAQAVVAQTLPLSSPGGGGGGATRLHRLHAAAFPGCARMKAPGIAQSHRLHVEDVRCATLLSELVYRAAESADEADFRQAQVKVEQEVGATLSHVRCHKSGGQRFLVGETQDALYVAFQGTKSAIDWLANLNFFHGHFGWQHHNHNHHGAASSSSISSSDSSSSSVSFAGSSSSSHASSTRSRRSRAHIGFLKRANSAAVSISELHAAAAAAGKRLVLTGHSLGGAVAVLTTVRLLRALAAGHSHGSTSSSSDAGNTADGLRSWGSTEGPHVRCISFATPAMANSDLLQEVTAAGWDQYITNIVMPEDPVVPFVNLLLKAPASPSQPAGISPQGLFAGLDLSSRSPSPSSSGVSLFDDLTCSNGSESQLSLTDSNWGASLQFEASMLSEELSSTIAANATAALQPLQDTLQAAADGWLKAAESELALAQQAVARSFSLAVASDVGCSLQPGGASVMEAAAPVLEQSTGSRELASWLAAARGAVQQQQQQQPSQLQQPGPSSFVEGSRFNSRSGNSLCSLQSEILAQWPTGSLHEGETSSSMSGGWGGTASPDSLSPISSPGSGYTFGMPIVASWALSSSTSLSSLGSSTSQAEEIPSTMAGADGAAEAGAATSSSSSSSSPSSSGVQGTTSQGRPNVGAKLVRQLQRLQQHLAATRVGRLAWIGGALAAGARCAAALAAPTAVAAGQPLPLLAFLPRALAGPAALAVLHFVGHAAYQAALPPSHPLGQQWVMTGSGLEPVAKPLTSYPRTGEGLGLKELGGLFPGHRMIAYRRRLANLVSQSSPASQQE